MKLKHLTGIYFLILFALLTSVVYLSSVISNYSSMVIVEENNRFESQELAHTLEMTSNDLTRMARLYSLTREDKYKNVYNEILSIRNGSSRRPINYNTTFWDRFLAGEVSENEYIDPISLYDLFRNSGITNDELYLLAQGETLSNNLSIIENNAFDLIYLGSGKSQQEAIDLLNSKDYYYAKLKIREPIQEFSDIIELRTSLLVDEYRKKELFYSNITILLVIATLLFSIYFYILIYKRIIRPIKNLSSVTREIKSGNLNVRGQVFVNDEIGELTVSFNEMSDLLSKQISELDAQKKIMDEHSIISITDTDGIITYSNDKFSNTSGYENHELIGQNHKILKSSEHNDEFYDAMWEAISSGHIWNGEIKNKRKDGSFYWVSATIAPIMGADEKPNRYISIRTDITDQKLIESKLRIAKNAAEDATKAKSYFLANMSHEIRTPMNAIIGFSDLALTVKDMPAISIDYLEKVNLSAKHLLSIINDILDFSKIEAGKLSLEKECFNLPDSIYNAFQIMQVQASSKNLDLTYNYSEDLPKCFKGDSVRVKQILFNIIGNSLKFTSSGSVSLNVEKDGQLLLFTVKDTGIGMTEKQLGSIFESFSQADASTLRKYGGTGLGTTISRQLVEAMGGRIWAESDYGHGSTFFFTLQLPHHLCQEGCIIKDKIENSNFEALKSYNILLAEDNELNGELVQINLGENLGHKITWAKNGSECVDLYIKNPSHYHVILMDFQMPIMDGLTASKKIRDWEEGKDMHITIIALTASATAEDQKRCFDSGMDSFVKKPIDFSELKDSMSANIPPNLGSSIARQEDTETDTVTNNLDALRRVADVDSGIRMWLNESSYIKALIRFADKYENSGPLFVEMIENDKIDESIRLAHTLKGMSLGLNDFGKIAKEIESKLKEKDTISALKLIPDLESELTPIIEIINDLEIIEEDISSDPIANIDVDVKQLISDLIASLDEDDPDPAEEILAKLKRNTPKNVDKNMYEELLSSIENEISNFDFDESKLFAIKLKETIESEAN